MNVSKTTIASAVAGIFNLSKQDEIARSIPNEYQFGVFAELDYRVLMSHLWQLRSDIVMLQKFDAAPLADAPRAGARDHKDSSTGADEREEERLELLRKACLAHALIERRLESLAGTDYILDSNGTRHKIGGKK